MDKELEYSISTWVGLKRSFPLIGQPKIKLCFISYLALHNRIVSDTFVWIITEFIATTFNLFLIKQPD